jgi:hypothetical protein
LQEIEITIEPKHLKIASLIGILGAILIAEIIIPLNTPINFGDEGFHTLMIQWISNKKEIPVWLPMLSTELTKSSYSGSFLYHIVTASLMPFGFNEILVRFIVPFCAILSGLTTFIFAKKIGNENAGWFAAILLVTFPSFVTYSVLLYKDAFFILYLTLFFLTFILLVQENRKKYLLLSGIFAAFAIFSKPTGFALLFFVAFAFLYEIIAKKKFLPVLKKYSLWLFVVILILGPFYLRNIYYYKGLCYLPFYPKFFEKIPLLSSKGCTINLYQENYKFAGRVEQIGTEANIFVMGLTSYLEFAYGNLFFAFFPFLAGLFLLLFNRTETNILLLLILLSFMPIVLFVSTGRAEDTARYTLGLSPIIALVGGIWFDKAIKFLNNYYKNFEIIIFIIVLVYCIWGLKFLGKSGYGFLDRLSVLMQVRGFSPTFFEACKWIKENLPENVRLMTIWCYRAVYNCQRNVIGNHPDVALSRDVNYTLNVTKQLGITHLFIQKFSIDYKNQHLSERYDWDFVKFLESHPEHFKKIYENGPPLQQCLQAGGCDGNIIYEIIY